MLLHVGHRYRPSTFVGGAIACWMLFGLCTTAQAQLVFKLDHFKCYITTDAPVNEPVVLQDQFDRTIGADYRENVVVWRPVRFCNPVEKRRLDTSGHFSPITNKESHLEMYRMFADDPDFAPTRRVVVENQFGKKTIRTFGQEVLAVPTTKNDEPPHHDLDHFKCYRAYGSNINRLVVLRDQFGVQDNVKVVSPFAFCNPTVKVHKGVTTPITNEDDHLVCYTMTKKTFSANVRTSNQFGIGGLTVRDADLLCVPSKKRRVVVG
jgi:hypothetical protein